MKILIQMIAVIAVIWALCYTVFISILLGEYLLVTLSNKPLPQSTVQVQGTTLPIPADISSILGNTIRNITNMRQSMCQPPL